MDLGNFAVAALIFGQLASGAHISITMLILGFLLALTCFFSYLIS